VLAFYNFGPRSLPIILIIVNRHSKTCATADHDLASVVAFGFEQNGIHVDDGLQATSFGLNRLCASDFTAPRAYGGIVGHVLGFEGSDSYSRAREKPAQACHDDALSHVGGRPHHHEASGPCDTVHENAITRRISVTEAEQ